MHDNTFIARHLGGVAFNPSDYNHFATAMEIVGMGQNSGLRVENNQFITHDRFFSSNTWKGPFYPTPVYAGDVVIRDNTWSREPSPAPTRKYDLFFMSSALYGLRFVDSNGGDFRDFGTGWPWLSCAWSAAYAGTIRTVTSGEAPVPGILVEVRDCSGTLIAAPTIDQEGRAALTLADVQISTHGHNPDTTQVTECNPYEFTAFFPGGESVRHTVIDHPGWIVTLMAEPAGAEPGFGNPDEALRLDPPSVSGARGTIRFTLPDRGPTTLALFAPDGRRVALLFEGALDRGDHCVSWEANRLESGIHFLRLRWAGHQQSASVVVVR